MALPLISGIGSLVAGFLAKIFTSQVLLWGSLKILLISIFTVVVPTVIHKLITKYLVDAVSIFAGSVGTQSSITVDLIGMGGYLASEVGLPECFSILMSAIVLKLTLRFIPFVRF